jgi:class 3 adenylate cyclase
MTLLDDVKSSVSTHMAGTYETFQPRDIPKPEDIPEGAKAARLTVTSLFIDLRQSSDITNALRRQTAAKVLKAYFSSAVRIINANDGYVRSFNGDGMLALFRDDGRSDNAVKAAMQVKWFVEQVLQPRFERYFESNRRAFGASLGFDIGCGLDDGDIYAVKVGIRGTNDVAWVGRCTNTSAKLSNLAQPPRNIWITRPVYERLGEGRKLSSGAHMWSDEFFREIGGINRAIRLTTYRWSIS